jgi:hypothetical protein
MNEKILCSICIEGVAGFEKGGKHYNSKHTGNHRGYVDALRREKLAALKMGLQ